MKTLIAKVSGKECTLRFEDEDVAVYSDHESPDESTVLLMVDKHKGVTTEIQGDFRVLNAIAKLHAAHPECVNIQTIQCGSPEEAQAMIDRATATIQ